MSTNTDSCAICRNPLNNGQRTESPGECNHIFHEACMDILVTNAIDGSNIPCPVCRKNLVPPHMRDDSEYILGNNILGNNKFGNNKFGGKRTLKAKGKRSLRKTKTKRKRKTKTKRKTKSKSRKTGVKRKKY